MAKRRRVPRRGRCRFCRDKVDCIDYKNVDKLNDLMTSQGRLQGRKRTGSCARHQRQAQQAVKRARFLALVPYC